MLKKYHRYIHYCNKYRYLNELNSCYNDTYYNLGYADGLKEKYNASIDFYCKHEHTGVSSSTSTTGGTGCYADCVIASTSTSTQYVGHNVTLGSPYVWYTNDEGVQRWAQAYVCTRCGQTFGFISDGEIFERKDSSGACYTTTITTYIFAPSCKYATETMPYYFNTSDMEEVSTTGNTVISATINFN